ncbi:hypothetical protein BDV93DRAFT_607936 [Ceratobasidium sp. AG-I]|nr:hypothetical protein BDV93DRAFT_607936 [Ceratobasidium sp. AG-I]
MATNGSSVTSHRFLRGLYQDPSPFDTALTYQRRAQRRPLTRNPFKQPEESAELVAPELPRRASDFTDEQDSTKLELVPDTKTTDGFPMLKNPGPTWVYLFYDLAWTATFATLTANGQLNEPWDSFSYIAFFVVVWWMWASQVLYAFHFYTNDWFHLLSIFLQLIIFGMLAATTRGFDVTNYILHSPGITDLVPMEKSQILDPDRYAAESLAQLSIEIIALSIAISRVLLLAQYLRVLFYARKTTKTSHVRAPWWKLSIIPLGLFISTGLFFGAWGVARSPRGRTHHNAKIKFILWGVGLLVEGVSHIGMSHISWVEPNLTLAKSNNQKPDCQIDSQLDSQKTLLMPYSDVTTRSRLEAITTIILGEGINGIAGALFSVISVPTLDGPIVINVACAAFIVYFLAHLYFEGVTGNRELKEHGRRRVYWVLLHLPLLLSIVLLLQGVKNQFILTNFLGNGDTIPKNVQDQIDQYNSNSQLPLDDWYSESDSLGSLHYYKILTDLLESKLQTTRYIMAMAGSVLIFMAILDVVHSRPRDRYQWGSILSRFLMGLILNLLLLLNIGRYRTLWVYEDQKCHQAGVYLWLEAYWVLPTIAIAFALQFLIDFGLVWYAVYKYKLAIGSGSKSGGVKMWLLSIRSKIGGVFRLS